METRDLQTFLAVAETGSITKTAALLGRSQPSVSRTIQELEAELGFALLHRVGRRVMLSEEGIAFAGEARRLLASFTELAERAKMIAAGKGRVLQIASTAAVATALIPNALARLDAATLPPEIHVAQYTPSTVAQEVRAGRAEIGYSSLPLDVPGLDVLRLYAASDVAALPADDPLVELDVVPLSAFDGRRMVTLLNPLRFQRHVAQAMERQGTRPGPVIRTNVAFTALQMVRRTGAIAVIDPLTAYGIGLPDIVIRPIDATVPFYWGAVTANTRQEPLHPLTQALLDAVEAVASEIIPDLTCLDPARAGDVSVGAGQDLLFASETPHE